MPNGLCSICGLKEHRLFYNYKTLGILLDDTAYGTIKTWASLTHTWLKKAHPNLDIAWSQLKRTVNSLPAGAPMILKVASGQQRSRAFRPLPPPLAPRRFDGCVAAAWAHRDVLIGPTFTRTDLETAINTRKQR